MEKNLPTYADAVKEVEQQLNECTNILKSMLFHAELSLKERDALTDIAATLYDAQHKIIEAKYINVEH